MEPILICTSEMSKTVNGEKQAINRLLASVLPLPLPSPPPPLSCVYQIVLQLALEKGYLMSFEEFFEKDH